MTDSETPVPSPDQILRDAIQFHRQVLQNVREGIVVFDRNQRYVVFNAYMEELTGLSAAQVVGAHPAELFPGFTGSSGEAALQRALAGEHVQRAEVELVRTGGEVRWVSDEWAPIRAVDGAITGVVVAVRDITEERGLEAQLRQAQKMEAIALLAGGVAHDFNNLLTAISGYARFLEETVTQPGQRRDVTEILKAADRAASLTRQLLAFSRQQVLDRRVVNPNELVASLLQMLDRIIGEQIQLLTSLADDAGEVRADPSQIEQVLMNLMVNARDAMPSGGRIRIETSRVHVPEDEPQGGAGEPVPPGDWVLLMVSDTGVGMSEQVKARMFEPFFTTKESGKGTGLGLATTYGIVAQSGGQIRVYSEPGKGTTFRVYLPRMTAPLPPRPATSAARPLPRGGGETVLLVEDEPGVRLLASRILTRGGYKVLEAGNPEQAEAVFATASEPVVAMVTDMVMPGGKGDELFARLKSKHAALKVVYMSGYTAGTVLDNQSLGPDEAFLQKPFTAEALLGKVGEMIALP